MALTPEDIAAVERIIEKNYNSLAEAISRSFGRLEERLLIADYRIHGHLMAIDQTLAALKQDASETPLGAEE